jgi:aspartate kinase
MHSRSIEFGKKFGVPIRVLNSASFADDAGTVIGTHSEASDRAVSGCALTKNEARISIAGIPDKPGTMNRIFSKLAAINVAVDMIVQNVGAAGKADISFTVLETDLPAALAAALEAATDLGGEVSHDANLSKVSVVGLGMATQTGVADRMFRALADAQVNIQAITTSQIKISCLVERAQGMAALRAVHDEFELEKPPGSRSNFGNGVKTVEPPSAVDIVSRLQRMEDLTIDDVKLDQSQGRVTIARLPDRPGIAAVLFEAIAAEGILVDMIVQGAGRDGVASLSFTVPRADVARAVQVASEAIGGENVGPVTSDPAIAILSVFGIGIRTHTGVGQRMFKALSEAGINVEMVSTSEVRVNVVVAANQGEAGLKCLRAAFTDVMG